MLKITNKGQSAIEFATICIVVSVAAVLCLDIGVLVIANNGNDLACHEAARAASAAPDKTAALEAAQAAVAAYARNRGSFASAPKVDIADFLYQDFDSSTAPAGSANLSPFVRVTTEAIAVVPAPSVFMGMVPLHGTAKNSVKLRKTCVFPLARNR